MLPNLVQQGIPKYLESTGLWLISKGMNAIKKHSRYFEFLPQTCEQAVKGRASDFCLDFFIRISPQVVRHLGSLYKRTTPLIHEIVQTPPDRSGMSHLQEENSDSMLKNITKASAVES